MLRGGGGSCSRVLAPSLGLLAGLLGRGQRAWSMSQTPKAPGAECPCGSFRPRVRLPLSAPGEPRGRAGGLCGRLEPWVPQQEVKGRKEKEIGVFPPPTPRCNRFPGLSAKATCWPQAPTRRGTRSLLPTPLFSGCAIGVPSCSVI